MGATSMPAWLVIEGESKQCPLCAETIKAEARICHYCGARYAVEIQGYCAREHGLKAADTEGRCASCGGELVDRQVRSRLLGGKEVPIVRGPSAHPAGTPASTAIDSAGPSMAASPARSQVPRHPTDGPGRSKPRRGSWIPLIAFGVVAVGVWSIARWVTTSSADRASPLEILGVPPKATATPSIPPPTATREPTLTQTPLPLGAGVGSQDFTIGPACFASPGFGDFGLNCLGENGWQAFTTANSPLRSDYIDALALCPDGTLLIAHDRGVQVFDGKTFIRGIPSGGAESATALACGEGGAIAVGYHNGVSLFEAGAWRKLDLSRLAPPEEPDASLTIQDMDFDAQGALWVVADFYSTDGSVGRYDGSDWTVHRESTALLPEIDLISLAVDQSGRAWVGYEEGLFALEGEQWARQPLEGLTELTDLFIDTDDRVWFAHGAGFGWIKDGQWNLYEIDQEIGIPDDPNAIWVDRRGRVWLSTDYGAAVFDGEGWTSYHMHTSDLTVNNLTALSVGAGGPELSALAFEPSGTVSGRILWAGQPLQNAEVELCAIPPHIFFRGGSPCAIQPYSPGTTTDAEGRFSVTARPGHYFLTFTDQEGDWTRLTTGIAGMVPYRIVVESERQTELEDILLDE